MADDVLAQDGRVCTKCGEWKSAADFYKKDGRRKYVGPKDLVAQCRECMSAAIRIKRAADPEKFREWERRSWRKRFEENGPKKAARSLLHRLKKRSMSLDQFEQLLDEHDHRCGICGSPLFVGRQGRDNSDYACLDHDHATGRVRGILCNPCNSGLGMFRDDPDRLERAAAYLRKWALLDEHSELSS